MSANLIFYPAKPKKKTIVLKNRASAKARKVKPLETIEEEAEYQKKVQWLQDHGESDLDEPREEGELPDEEDPDDSSESD